MNSRKYIHGKDSKWLFEGQMCIQNIEEKTQKVQEVSHVKNRDSIHRVDEPLE